MMMQLMLVVIALLMLAVDGFMGLSIRHHQHASVSAQRLYSEPKPPQVDMQAQISRLNVMAAQLRAEAAELEATQAKARAEAVAQAFNSFDTNKDGSISVEELRQGLASTFSNLSITDEQAKKLLQAFDASGDGAIQLDEFQGAEAFKNKLEQLLRDEREAALQATMLAREAKNAAELAEARSTALAQFLNDGKPNASDKLVSIIPYLFPLLDSIQYGRYLINNELDVPAVEVLTALYRLYENIPFSGLVAFFALSALSNNMRLNRLVRFNMQQAILLDIALIAPSLIGGIGTFLLPSFGLSPESPIVAAASTTTFLSFSALILYSTISSLLGVVPDKIPLVSERVEARVPTADMFDEQGVFLSKEERERRRKSDEEKK